MVFFSPTLDPQNHEIHAHPAACDHGGRQTVPQTPGRRHLSQEHDDAVLATGRRVDSPSDPIPLINSTSIFSPTFYLDPQNHQIHAHPAACDHGGRQTVPRTPGGRHLSQEHGDAVLAAEGGRLAVRTDAVCNPRG